MTCAAFSTIHPENAVMPQDMQPDTEATSHGTPLKALRAHCVECCNGNFAEVRACTAQTCPLWLFRHGRNPTAAERAAVAGQPVHPLERTLAGASGLKAIRRRCLDCSGNSEPAVRSCKFTGCNLYAFRRGRNPNINRSAEVRIRQSSNDREQRDANACNYFSEQRG
jgi:hypothetical protein